MIQQTKKTARRRRSLLVHLVAAGLAAGSLYAASSAAAATSLGDTFESGRPTGWSRQVNVTVGDAFAREGSLGARSVSTPDQLGYLMWNKTHVTQGKRYARVGGWVKIASFRAGESVSIAVVRNAHGVHHFNMWRNANSGRFQYDLHRSNSARSTMTARVGSWYFIEALIDYGDTASNTYTARVRINGVDQPTIRSTGQVGTTVKLAYFGDTVLGNSSTRHYDNLALSVSDTPLSFTR